MRNAETGKLTCDMSRDCTAPVTHLEEKGYIYCTAHAADRRTYGHRCRKLRPHEIKRLEGGGVLARY